MDFSFTKEEEAFRQELRDFLKTELPPDWKGIDEWNTEEEWQLTQQWAKKLAARGWLTLSWPKEYGGGGGTIMEQLVYREEMYYGLVPGVDMGVGGIAWVGPSLMLFGTEEQKREHLPPIGRGDRFWCTGYSEPGAGSDLASLQLRAVAEADEWVLNGQKVWTSCAHRAHWCWLAARTDPNAPKHRGISMFIVDMKTPGITVRPLINTANEHSFNEIFFDDVHIPKRNLVGELNRGWYHLATALDFERARPAIARSAFCRRFLDELVAYAKETASNGKPLGQDPVVRRKLADMAVEVETMRMIAWRIAWMQSKGLIPNYEASMGKVYGDEVTERLVNTGMELMGMHGLLEAGSKWAPLKGCVAVNYLRMPGSKHGGGSDEIQKNIVALRGLGMPRGKD